MWGTTCGNHDECGDRYCDLLLGVCDDDCSAPSAHCVELPDATLRELLGITGYCSTVSDEAMACSE
jgi:hypothetical protein